MQIKNKNYRDLLQYAIKNKKMSIFRSRMSPISSHFSQYLARRIIKFIWKTKTTNIIKKLVLQYLHKNRMLSSLATKFDSTLLGV